MKYDVVMLSSKHQLTDHRIAHKEAASLAQQGYKVLHLGISEKPQKYNFKGVELIGIKGNHKKIYLTPLKIILSILPINAKVYHIHDFELLIVAPFIKLIKCGKVIYDSHEDYVFMIRDVLPLPKPLNKLLSKIAWLYEFLLTYFFVDVVIVAVEEQIERFKKEYHFKKPVITIHNYPVVKYFDLKSKRKEWDLIYVGTANDGRMIKELCEVISKTKLKVCFVLGGNKLYIDQLLKKYSNNKNLTFLLFQPYDQIPKLLSKAKVGLIFFKPGVVKYYEGLPVKMLEYASAGLPFIGNKVNRWVRRGIEKFKIGVNIEQLTPKNLEHAFNKIISNYDTYSERAKKIAKRFSWENEEKKLFGFYLSVIHK